MRSSFVSQFCGQAVVQVVGGSTCSPQFYTTKPLTQTNDVGINHFLYSFYPLRARILFHSILSNFTSVNHRVVRTIHSPNKDCDNVYINNYLTQAVEEKTL